VAAGSAWRRFGALQAVILVQVASFVLIFVLARYRLVLVACLMPFACRLMLRGAAWVRERRAAPLAAALAGLVLLSFIGGLRYAAPQRGEGFADQWLFVGQVQAADGDLERAGSAFEAASEADWIDPRGANESRWRALVALAATRVEQGRREDALQTLDLVSREIRRDYPLGHPMDERIGQLRDRAHMLP
jgi:hypothetical protein